MYATIRCPCEHVQADSRGLHLTVTGPIAQPGMSSTAGMELDLGKVCMRCPVYASSPAQIPEGQQTQQIFRVKVLHRSSPEDADKQLDGAGLALEEAGSIRNVLLPGDAVCFRQGQHQEMGVIEGFIWPDDDCLNCSPQQLKLSIVPVASASGVPATFQKWKPRRTRGLGTVELGLSSVICSACIVPVADYKSIIPKPGVIQQAGLSITCMLEDHASADPDQLAASLRSKLPPAWRRLEVLAERFTSSGTTRPVLCR